MISTDKWTSAGWEIGYIEKKGWIVVLGKKGFRIYSTAKGELVYSENLNINPISVQFLKVSMKLIMQKDLNKIGIWSITESGLIFEKELQIPMKYTRSGFIKCIEAFDILFFTTESPSILVYKISNGNLEKTFDTDLKKSSCIIPLYENRRILIGDGGSEKFLHLQFQ